MRRLVLLMALSLSCFSSCFSNLRREPEVLPDATAVDPGSGTGGSNAAGGGGSRNGGTSGTAGSEIAAQGGQPGMGGISGTGGSVTDGSAGTPDQSPPAPPVDAATPVSPVDVAMPVPCTNACTLGKTECVGTAIRTCVTATGSCSVWGNATACPTSQSCSQDECTCTNTCPAIGAKQCGPAGGTQDCIQDGLCRKWAPEKLCAEANGTALCSNGTCSFVACAAGFSRCGGVCKRNDAPNSCGAACAVCPAVENAAPVCAGGQCDSVCNAGFSRCALRTSCARTEWGFESNTLEGFDNAEPSQPLVVVDGGHSGRKAISWSGTYGTQFSVKIGCGDETGVASTNRLISAWAFVDSSDPGSTPSINCGINYTDATGQQRVGANTRPAPRQQWFQMTALVASTTVNRITVYCYDENFLGKRVLVDDVSLK